MIKHPIITTERLLLRPFRLADARDIQRLAGDRAIADTTLNIPHPYEDGMAEEWIEKHQARVEAGELVNFAIVLQASGELIGAMGLQLEPRFKRAEMAYFVGKPYWGRGYCTEAARAVMDLGFGTLNLNRIHASHISRNPASGRVMVKLGMVHEGCQRQHIHKWDRFEDLELYGIVKDQWPGPSGATNVTI